MAAHLCAILTENSPELGDRNHKIPHLFKKFIVTMKKYWLLSAWREAALSKVAVLYTPEECSNEVIV